MKNKTRPCLGQAGVTDGGGTKSADRVWQARKLDGRLEVILSARLVHGFMGVQVQQMMVPPLDLANTFSTAADTGLANLSKAKRSWWPVGHA
jgi:hypothetical protein